jgi:hypothetical protein
MTFRRISAVFIAVLLVSSLASAGTTEFGKGRIFITPQVGLNVWAIPFGLNAEYGLTPNIGIGATGTFWSWGGTYWHQSVISLNAEAAYHFTQLNFEKIDLYAGAGLGYSVYTVRYNVGYLTGATGASGIHLTTFVGGRYYFTPRIAASLILSGGVGNWAGVGAAVGVTFSLK